MRRSQRLTLLAALLGLPATAAAQWGNAQLLNEPGEAGIDVKTSRVIAAPSGGFHSIYHSANRVRYRRYDPAQSPPLRPVVNVFPGTNFMANANMALGPNGDLHVVFEDWTNGPEVRWYKSTNGGLSWPITQVISDSKTQSGCDPMPTDGHAKHPQIAGFGLGNSPTVVMSYWIASKQCDPRNGELHYNRYNGTSWEGDIPMGSEGNSQYEVTGIARSPLDGIVYRTFTQYGMLKMRRYNGLWWEPEMVLDSSGAMHNWQHVAINGAGQVMVSWDESDTYYSMLYTPGVGFGPKTVITGSGSWGQGLCGIPGTNQFYAAYPRYGAEILVGRYWTGGAWQPEENISNGLHWDFTVGPDLSAGADGTIYAVWEFWDETRNPVKPQQYYNIRPASAPGATGTISGFVRDQFGAGLPGAGVSTSGTRAGGSGAGGAYSIAVPPGTYTVTAFRQWYTPQTIANVSVAQNQTTTVNFTLTGQPPAGVTGFVVAASNESNTLAWTNPWSGQLSGVRVVYRTDRLPEGPDDGLLAFEDAAPPGSPRQVIHSGIPNGQTYFYRAYAFFADASRFYAASAPTASGNPAIAPDLDRDGDVDQVDIGLFQRCLSAPSLPPASGCLDRDLSGDYDVDQADFEILLNCVSGPGFYASPTCVP